MFTKVYSKKPTPSDSHHIIHTAGEFCEFITEKAAHHYKTSAGVAKLVAAPIAMGTYTINVAHRIERGESKKEALLSPMIDLGLGLWAPGYT